MFWSIAGLLLIVIGFVGNNTETSLRWWVWSLLLFLPLISWWLNSAKRDLLRLIATFTDELAKEFKLVKLDPETVARTMHSPRRPE
jgi:hypothetical protein